MMTSHLEGCKQDMALAAKEVYACEKRILLFVRIAHDHLAGNVSYAHSMNANFGSFKRRTLLSVSSTHEIKPQSLIIR